MRSSTPPSRLGLIIQLRRNVDGTRPYWGAMTGGIAPLRSVRRRTTFRPAPSWRPRFPENRENNREFFKFLVQFDLFYIASNFKEKHIHLPTPLRVAEYFWQKKYIIITIFCRYISSVAGESLRVGKRSPQRRIVEVAGTSPATRSPRD
jgi:hypothetical protein